jgi:hypothetical protein
MSLDCPFFIAPSVFSNVYLVSVQQSLFIACTCFILGCYDQRSLGVSWYSIQAQNNSAAACQTICNSTDYFALQVINYLRCKYFRERPFNLKGGALWFHVSFRIFFSDNTRVRIFIFFCRAKREFFFQNSTLGYMTKTESDFFFFPPPESESFVQQHWESS